ncbi:MAG: DUF4367 domain-containing protein [Firmicutes bacterium]|nr:DUF4367 domain-containing protein [Bacillota bacterium]
MNDRDKSDKILRELEEQQCDLVMISLGKYFKEESMHQLEEWEEEINTTELPETLDYKLKKITEKYEKADIAVVRKRRRKSYLRVCSLMLAVMVCVGGVSLASSEAMRKTVYNVLFAPGDGNVEVSFKEANADVNIPADMETILYPDYLPEGYVLHKVENDKGGVEIVFYNDVDYIVISYKSEEVILSLDLEKSENEVVAVNNEKAVIQNKDSKYILFYRSGDYNISLSCSQDIDKDKIIQIAENIKIYSVNELKEKLVK